MKDSKDGRTEGRKGRKGIGRKEEEAEKDEQKEGVFNNHEGRWQDRKFGRKTKQHKKGRKRMKEGREKFIKQEASRNETKQKAKSRRKGERIGWIGKMGRMIEDRMDMQDRTDGKDRKG
jgi:hypothetical protein